MPSLFRRKPADPVDEPVTGDVEPDPAPSPSRRGHTPSKKELGKVTPKRANHHPRRAGATKAPTDRKEAYRLSRERRREASAGMRAGDPRYLLPRDQGPERLLVRNIVDSRRTVGTWFFAGALIVLIGSSAMMPEPVRIAANLLWATLAIAVVLDSILICRRVKKLVRQRYPQTTQRMGSLYLYAVMRALMFRRARIPHPQVKIGDPV